MGENVYYFYEKARVIIYPLKTDSTKCEPIGQTYSPKVYYTQGVWASILYGKFLRKDGLAKYLIYRPN